MGSLGREIMGEIDLGDERLNKRLMILTEALGKQPGEGILHACGTWGEAVAAYRFFDNDSVAAKVIIGSIAGETVERCRGKSLVLAIQDTTSLDYTTHTDTKGLGPLETSHRQGLFAHTTLAVSMEGEPLGVLHQQVWARDPEEAGKRHLRKELPIEGKESVRWLLGMKESEEQLAAAGVRALMVADREADVYELFGLAQELDSDWLIRARHDRKLSGEEGQLLAAVEGAEVCAQITVELLRGDDRLARSAKLAVRRAQVVLKPPRRAVGVIDKWWEEHPEVERVAPLELRPVQVGVVLVTEEDGPEGEEPLRWLLMTNRSVESVEEAVACIGYYRLRWLVERFHYVLKSGCHVERLQLETAERLERALAVYVGVAWYLLWLTCKARISPEAPCTEVLEEDTWRLLMAVACRTKEIPIWPPSLRTAVREIAKLGGFLGRRSDGEPGVKTIWRGLRRLFDMTIAYRALREHPELFSSQPEMMTCV